MLNKKAIALIANTLRGSFHLFQDSDTTLNTAKLNGHESALMTIIYFLLSAQHVIALKVILVGFLRFVHNSAKKTEPATALVTMEIFIHW